MKKEELSERIKNVKEAFGKLDAALDYVEDNYMSEDEEKRTDAHAFLVVFGLLSTMFSNRENRMLQKVGDFLQSKKAENESENAKNE